MRWYFNQVEFYRFVPREAKPTFVFPVSGINVDVSEIKHSHLKPGAGMTFSSISSASNVAILAAIVVVPIVVALHFLFILSIK